MSKMTKAERRRMTELEFSVGRLEAALAAAKNAQLAPGIHLAAVQAASELALANAKLGYALSQLVKAEKGQRGGWA